MCLQIYRLITYIITKESLYLTNINILKYDNVQGIYLYEGTIY